ncbi:MAG: Type 1 glutamine amidotransferase-like domain-containing protein [Candidatus Zixiibacteriota bacterium]
MHKLFLIGGGWNESSFPLTQGRFIEAIPSSGRKILVIAASPTKTDSTRLREHCDVFVSLGLFPDELVPLHLTPEEPLTLKQLEEIQPTGIFVCGGLTPAYQEALCKNRDWLEYLKRTNIPYAGFSAGSAIAASDAIVGGWQLTIDGRLVPILDEELAEDLDAVDVRPGLGFVPFSIDVHASQWGTISRLMHAIDQGMVKNGWAIDEDTMLEINGDAITVHGLGQTYFIEGKSPGRISLEIHRAE